MRDTCYEGFSSCRRYADGMKGQRTLANAHFWTGGIVQTTTSSENKPGPRLVSGAVWKRERETASAPVISSLFWYGAAEVEPITVEPSSAKMSSEW